MTKVQPKIRKPDANQAEIVEALRRAGASVQPIHTIGQGVPDLLVDWHNRTFLIEVKTKGGKLTPDELAWLEKWTGTVAIVHSVEEAVEALR